MVAERRRSRWAGFVAIGLRRVWTRATRTKTGRVVTTLAAVALTIALLVVITGLALALADGGVASADDGDVHVLPADGRSLSAVDGVEPTRLGASVDTSEAMRDEPGVDHASPVFVEPGPLESAAGDASTRLLLVGMVPDDDSRSVAGLPTDALTSESAGENGEVVLSAPAADALGVADGDEVVVPPGEFAPDDTPHELTVATVATDADEAPVALLSLGDLHAIAGVGEDQLADRIVLWGDSDRAGSVATEGYPEASVQSVDTADPTVIFDDGVALATGVLALLVGLVVASAFVATTAGMTVEADRQSLAVLESVGIARSGRLTIVTVSTLLTTVIGGLVGGLLGVVGIHSVNLAAAATVAHGSVAIAHPALVPYAVVVALLAGVLALPYPLLIAARTSTLAEVGR